MSDFEKSATIQLLKKEILSSCKSIRNCISLLCTITDSDILFDSHLNNCVSIIERNFV